MSLAVCVFANIDANWIFFCKKIKGPMEMNEMKPVNKELNCTSIHALHTYVPLISFRTKISAPSNCSLMFFFSLFICILTMSRSWNKKNESEYRNTFPPSECQWNEWNRRKRARIHSFKMKQNNNSKRQTNVRCSLFSVWVSKL